MIKQKDDSIRLILKTDGSALLSGTDPGIIQGEFNSNLNLNIPELKVYVNE